jgi:hypothetical protein
VTQQLLPRSVTCDDVKPRSVDIANGLYVTSRDDVARFAGTAAGRQRIFTAGTQTSTDTIALRARAMAVKFRSI